MLEDGVIPTVAPGQWRTATKPNDTTIVLATFAGSRDDAALRVQLESWLHAVRERAAAGRRAPIALPVSSDADGALQLEFDAPMHVGPEVTTDEAQRVQGALAFLRDAADAIDALHAVGLVHGEIGPASFWRTADGRLLFPDAGLSHTLAGIMEPPAASAAYRAPEVWRGRNVVPASDQYSLAVIAFELLSGRPRVVHSTEEGLTSLEPLGLESGVPVYRGAPPQLTEVLQRALAASPAARFENCTAFIEALSGHAPLPASMPTVHRRMLGDLAVTRRSTMVLSVVAVLAVAGAATAVKRGLEKKTGLPSIGIDLPRVSMRGGTAPVIASASEGGGTPSSGRGAARPGATGRGAEGVGASSGLATEVPGRVASGAAGSRAQASPASAMRLSGGAGAVASSSSGASFSPSGIVSNAVPTAGTSRSVTSGAGSDGGSAERGATPSVGRTLERAGSALARSISRPGVNSSSASRSAPAVASANGSLSVDLAGRSEAPRSLAVQERSVRAPAGAPGAEINTAAAVPSPVTGTVLLRLTRGQTVYVDGVQTRVVSGRLSLPAGAHDIDIVAPDGSRTRRRVSVVAGGSITIAE